MDRRYGYALGAVGLIGLGASVMYFLDPKSGPRRRAAVRDQARHGYRAVTDGTARFTTDCLNHSRGLVARLTEPFREEPVPDDDVLLARIRSRIGHVVPAASGLEVKADHGCVSLSGKLNYPEARKVLKTIASTRGVAAVENKLAIEMAH